MGAKPKAGHLRRPFEGFWRKMGTERETEDRESEREKEGREGDRSREKEDRKMAEKKCVNECSDRK